MRRRIGYGDLLPGDTLTSKTSDFVLLKREAESFTWLDLHEAAFTVDLNPTHDVPLDYTILRAGKVFRRGLE